MKKVCGNHSCSKVFDARRDTCIYCCRQCAFDQKMHDTAQRWLIDGDKPHPRTIRMYLTKTYGNKCSCCGITEWQNKRVVFEIEHKDGNSENNSVENLCLLCPNCHSQTPTYKNRNKGNGRHSRRERYAQGKSY